MTNRRDFLKTMLAGLGTAATAHDLGLRVSGQLWNRSPKQRKMMVPPGNSFLLERVTFMNSRGMVENPHLLIDTWEFKPRILVGKEPVTIVFERPIVLAARQKIALLARENTMAGFHGWKCYYQIDAVEAPKLHELRIAEMIPYAYWLRV